MKISVSYLWVSKKYSQLTHVRKGLDYFLLECSYRYLYDTTCGENSNLLLVVSLSLSFFFVCVCVCVFVFELNAALHDTKSIKKMQLLVVV